MSHTTILNEKSLAACGYKTLRNSITQADYRIDPVHEGALPASKFTATSIFDLRAIWAVTLVMVILMDGLAAVRCLL